MKGKRSDIDVAKFVLAWNGARHRGEVADAFGIPATTCSNIARDLRGEGHVLRKFIPRRRGGHYHAAGASVTQDDPGSSTSATNGCIGPAPETEPRVIGGDDAHADAMDRAKASILRDLASGDDERVGMAAQRLAMLERLRALR